MVDFQVPAVRFRRQQKLPCPSNPFGWPLLGGSWQVLTGKPDVISYAREKDGTWRRRKVNRKNQLKRGDVSWNEEVWKIEKIGSQDDLCESLFGSKVNQKS